MVMIEKSCLDDEETKANELEIWSTLALSFSLGFGRCKITYV